MRMARNGLAQIAIADGEFEARACIELAYMRAVELLPRRIFFRC